MKIENLFIPFDLAIEAKFSGFSDWCFGAYFQQDGNQPYLLWGKERENAEEGYCSGITKECDAPLYDQIFQWLEEKDVLIQPCFEGNFCLLTYDKQLMSAWADTRDQAIKIALELLKQPDTHIKRLKQNG